MEDRNAVLRELERVLASPQFSSSKRYPALLQYVVKNTLDGKSDLLKERTLGVEVFDRLPTYDTNADTVVRYTAGEVRKRLLLYYHEQGRSSQIRISLPAGSYVPEFLHEPEDRQETDADPASASDPLNEPRVSPTPAGEVRQPPAAPLQAFAPPDSSQAAAVEVSSHSSRSRRSINRRLLWVACAVTLVAIAAIGLNWRYRTLHPKTALDDFWSPVLHLSLIHI